MNLQNLIDLKNNREPIPDKDIKSLIKSFVQNEIDDKSMTEFLIAVKTHGMTMEETISLTSAMLNSGEKVEFTEIDTYVSDKHSTGGVGDKVSLILGPILAAGGQTVPMLAGRSLAHTGGTIDKLETYQVLKLIFQQMILKTMFKKRVFVLCLKQILFAPQIKKCML